jgi:hypothetical protein
VENTSNSKGKILVIIFLAVILLPLGYSIFKELILKKEADKATTTQLPTEGAVKK